jgi:protein-disulfide isomerase
MLTPPVTSADHMMASPDWTVTLVEYGDYACQTCARTSSVVKEVQAVLGPDLRYVFRHFPLYEVHRHSREAAWLAEGAAAIGRFWEMHELLFSCNASLDLATLEMCGARLHMSQHQVNTALTGLHRRKVDLDVEGGMRSGVVGTPTFFIEGKRYNGSIDAGRLLQTLEALV